MAQGFAAYIRRTDGAWYRPGGFIPCSPHYAEPLGGSFVVKNPDGHQIQALVQKARECEGCVILIPYEISDDT